MNSAQLEWQSHIHKNARTSNAGTLIHCLLEYKLVQQWQKTVWRFLKYLKTDLPHDPVIPYLRIYANDIKLNQHMRESSVAPCL